MAQGDLTKLEGRLHTAATSPHRRSRPGHYGRTEWLWAAHWIEMPVMEGEHFQSGTASLGILGLNPAHPGLRVVAQWNAVMGVRAGVTSRSRASHNARATAARTFRR